MLKLTSLLAPLSLLLLPAACTSESEPALADAAPLGADATLPGAPDAALPPIDGVYRFVIEPFDVPAGSERQVCKYVALPDGAAVDVVSLHSTMTGTSHHFNAYKLLGDGATAPIRDGEGVVHDCQPASGQLEGTQAYIFGAGLPERSYALPAGVSFHLPAKQLLLLEQHVINASDAVIQGGVMFDLSATATPIEHHAEIGWFANWGFYIQPGTQSFTTECDLPYNIELFGLTSHTHSLGIQFDIEHVVGGAGEEIYSSNDWQHPMFGAYAPTRQLDRGDALRWTCTWDNTTSDIVLPGKESTDEMCITFAYYYPRDTLDATPINCNRMF